MALQQGTAGNPSTTGVAQPSAALRLQTANNGAIDFGVNGSGNGWMQVADVSNLATIYHLLLQPNGGYVGIGCAPSYQLQLSSDSAAKPSTSTWTVASDARLKTVLSDFTDGLEVARRLRPYNYRYNGLGGTPEGLEGIGLIAQETQLVCPYMVTTRRGKLRPEDAEETDIYMLNPHAVPYILLNSVVELEARLAALEARV